MIDVTQYVDKVLNDFLWKETSGEKLRVDIRYIIYMFSCYDLRLRNLRVCWGALSHSSCLLSKLIYLREHSRSLLSNWWMAYACEKQLNVYIVMLNAIFRINKFNNKVCRYGKVWMVLHRNVKTALFAYFYRDALSELNSIRNTAACAYVFLFERVFFGCSTSQFECLIGVDRSKRIIECRQFVRSILQARCSPRLSLFWDLNVLS